MVTTIRRFVCRATGGHDMVLQQPRDPDGNVIRGTHQLDWRCQRCGHVESSEYLPSWRLRAELQGQAQLRRATAKAVARRARRLRLVR